jgi:hypothetical protein
VTGYLLERRARPSSEVLTPPPARKQFAARVVEYRFGGRAALEEFTELRWITVGGPEGRHYPI